LLDRLLFLTEYLTTLESVQVENPVSHMNLTLDTTERKKRTKTQKLYFAFNVIVFNVWSSHLSELVCTSLARNYSINQQINIQPIILYNIVYRMSQEEGSIF
jgi:hypothetical protein